MAHNYYKNYKVSSNDLESKLLEITRKYLDSNDSTLLVKLIIRTEKMNVPTHGLHYFVHSIYPLLEKRSDDFHIDIKNNIIHSNGVGGIGFINLYNCLKIASEKSEKYGLSMLLVKNPGKVGALRTYAVDLINSGKLVIITKNTAATQSFKPGEQLIGTNPFCIGFPSTNFIYDSSTSATCTNGMRLMDKQDSTFKVNVGWDENGLETNVPSVLLSEGSTLSTFANNSFWYKSFFLGVAIESLAALAGGNTGDRVGKKKGKRLYSKEGLFCIVIDKEAFPYYSHYKDEIKILFDKLETENIHIPGTKSRNDELLVSKKDWDFINSL